MEKWATDQETPKKSSFCLIDLFIMFIIAKGRGRTMIIQPTEMGKIVLFSSGFGKAGRSRGWSRRSRLGSDAPFPTYSHYSPASLCFCPKGGGRLRSTFFKDFIHLLERETE